MSSAILVAVLILTCYSQLKKRVAECATENDELKQQQKNWQRGLSARKREMERAQTEITQLSGTIKQLTGQAAANMHQAEEAEREVKKLKKQQKSRAWQLKLGERAREKLKAELDAKISALRRMRSKVTLHSQRSSAARRTILPISDFSFFVVQTTMHNKCWPA